MDGIDSLRHAIETIPIPGAPPRLSRQGAAVGLALLDTSLRLNHVRRLTERLTVVEHGTARRSTEVDVSLKLLDEGQRQATAQLQDLIGQEHGERATSRPARQRSLWVPLARLPRRDVSPSTSSTARARNCRGSPSTRRRGWSPPGSTGCCAGSSPATRTRRPPSTS